ncbi:molybdate transport system substrate-binding protein [Wenyingzhuangia heitensis]|uniref:Molybdate transport system substrate-binding protein n=1 Tax=Wenyingzhuangia heitensis TaxID=1487859 RepID=A0ABX0UBP2_9FLAO|nr:molybdate ABC transporter substrate-binding protein [Wenyingzhuangia heitensis]NIJ44976.1 molybdate transport system substrate-binding protein [Wenyingzhuangia heitensis]
MRFFYIIFSLFICVACQSPKHQKLNIAVAANMQYAIKEIGVAFTKQSGILPNFIIASSGKLTAQIQQGAPYHVFLSADMKFPSSLHKDSLTLNKPKVYALGTLIIWTTRDSLQPNLNSLTSNKIKNIAIANPKTAPYGTAAIEVLKKHNLYSVLKDKLVFGESISQVNQFISTKATQIGFTSKSVIYQKNTNSKNSWFQISNNDYTPMQQGIVIIKQNDNQLKNSLSFYNFMFSKKAQQILKKHGYTTQTY